MPHLPTHTDWQRMRPSGANGEARLRQLCCAHQAMQVRVLSWLWLWWLVIIVVVVVVVVVVIVVWWLW